MAVAAMRQHVGYKDTLNLTISLCLTYTLCVACVRIWIRKGAFGADDLVIAIATVITLCQSAASYAALAEGLGIPWSDQESIVIPSLNAASIAGIVTFIVALYISKCAMLSFLSRITKTPSQIRLYFVCNCIVATTGIVSVLIATVGCPTAQSGYYWAFYANRSSCPSQTARWQTITGLDVITEVILLALPVHLIWGLQMPLRKKAMIIVAFYVRLPVLGFAIARNYYTMRLRLPHTDPGLGSALVVIWLEVELAYALAASTLSALKAFTESFNSGFGLGFTRGKGDDSYGMSNVSGSSGQSSKSKDPAALESTAAASRMGSIAPLSPDAAKGDIEVLVSPLTPTAETIEEHPALRLRPGSELNNFTHVSAEPMYGDHGPWRENSSANSESSAGGDDMVIMRETAYEVQHDRAPMLSVPEFLHA